MSEGRDEHEIPDGVSEATVAALGKLSEALETMEDARGCLYRFHRLTGRGDRLLQDAVAELRAAGHHALADRIDTELVGRDVLPGRWTFQVVEEYDDGYWEPLRALERAAREELAGGRRHLHEAAMKRREQASGPPGGYGG